MADRKNPFSKGQEKGIEPPAAKREKKGGEKKKHGGGIKREREEGQRRSEKKRKNFPGPLKGGKKKRKCLVAHLFPKSQKDYKIQKKRCFFFPAQERAKTKSFALGGGEKKEGKKKCS